MNALLKPPDIQHFLYLSVSLVSLCVQSVILLMATEGQAQSEPHTTTIWTDAETDALMDFLLANKAKLADAGSFRPPAFRAAAEHIQPLHTMGLPKTAKTCKSKYGNVCNFSLIGSGSVSRLICFAAVKRFLPPNSTMANEIWREFSVG